MNRTVVTLVGKDHVGIIAAVCNFFAENNINMILIVDTTGYDKGFDKLAEGLDQVGKSVGCIIKAQHEEIFDMMHRI